MKTEFLKSLIPETVEGRDEIIKKIFAANGEDVEKAKQPFSDYDTIKTQLAEAQATITTLKASAGDADALKAKIAEYEQKDAQRVEAEAKSAKQREIAQRFATVRGAVEFIDPTIEEAVLTKFSAALDDPANKGKGDAELYATLTKDKPFFKSQNPPVNMGGVGAVLSVDARAAMQKQYDDAVKAGKTAEAVALKNKLFQLPT